MIVLLEVGHRALVNRLQVESLHVVVHDEVLLFIQPAHRACLLQVFFVVAHYELVSDGACLVRVDVARPGLRSLQVALLAVATVKVLAHVTPYVVLEGEAPARMLADEIGHVEYVLVQDDKLLAFFVNHVEELGLSDIWDVFHGLDYYFVPLASPVNELACDQDSEEEDISAPYDGVAYLWLVVEGEVLGYS